MTGPTPSVARHAPAAAAIAAAGLVFAAHPLAHLAWLALVAPALGALAGGALPARVALPLPLVWCLPLAAWGAEAPPTPWWGALVALGLYGLGVACGALARGAAPACAGALLVVSLALAVAPARGDFARAPWPPRLASALLDLSPTALALEASGVDWMRHASVYEPVGSDRFERRASRGSLAGTTLVLVGYLAAAAAQLAARRRAGPGAHPCESSSAPSRST